MNRDGFNMVQLRQALLPLLFALLISNGIVRADDGDCDAADKAAMAKWFPHDQTSEPSTTLTSNTNCAFHVWSTQMFLWLTQTDSATGQPRLLSQFTLEDLFAPTGSPAPQRAEKRILRLTPKMTKSDQVDLNEVHQAGSSGVLVDQQNRAVYYSQFVNKTFYDFVRNRFFSKQPGGTFDPALMAAATGSDDFFPPGAMELKVSWKIVDAASGDGAFTIPAEIYKLKKGADGKIIVDTGGTPEQVSVALVGLHVVGVVDDHPEFIWATFEHRDNAPDLPAGLTPDSTDPVSATSWTFYAPNTPAKASNVNPAGGLTLDEATQALSPVVNVFRQFPFGTITGGSSETTNIANIQEINAFAAGNFQPSGSVWQNYMEVGAIWMLPNSLQPDQFPITQLRGSTMLSNATMETFTQAQQQCFSCHNTLPVFKTYKGGGLTLPGTNFNLSHILVQEYFRASAKQQGVQPRAIR